MNAHIERFLVIAGLFLSPVGCAVGNATETATVEEQASLSAQRGVVTPDAMSVCYDDYNCTGSVLQRGRSLQSCNNLNAASSWRSSGGKCFNL